MSTWLELCAEGKKIFQNPTPLQDVGISSVAQDLMSQSRKFGKAIAKPGTKVLDLGSCAEPWFSILAADNGAEVTAFDIAAPLQPNLLKQKGIEYIQGDIADMPNLGKFDLIFCRNMHPAALLKDWHNDSRFLKVWNTLLQMSNKIYWIQLGNGKGIPDGGRLPFVNHRREYFQAFFEKLGVPAKVSKYGFISFDIGNVLPDADSLPKYKDLSDDDLCKWFAWQMQDNPVSDGSRLANTLLRRNFWLDDFAKGELSMEGPRHDDYFITDEQEDRRFTRVFLNSSPAQRLMSKAKRSLRRPV